MKTTPLLLAILGLAPILPAGAAVAPSPGDTPLKVAYSAPVVFPKREEQNGVTAGEALLIVKVDPTGKLVDALVTAYTLKGFADEALNEVRQYRWQPGQVAGKPVWTTQAMAFEFNWTMLGTSRIGAQDEAYFELGKYAYTDVPLAKLDRLPARTKTVVPTALKDLLQGGAKGKVVVEYYIDETGKVRMPSIVSSNNPKLDGLLLPMVEHWQYEPPLKNGKPVLAKAQQTFEF